MGGKPREEDARDPGVVGGEHNPGQHSLPVPDELHGPLPHQLHLGPSVISLQAVNTWLSKIKMIYSTKVTYSEYTHFTTAQQEVPHSS